MTGKELIGALNKCNDDCTNCKASIKGKSCKEYMKAYKDWCEARHKEFGKVLENGFHG